MYVGIALIASPLTQLTAEIIGSTCGAAGTYAIPTFVSALVLSLVIKIAQRLELESMMLLIFIGLGPSST
jgi:hypothetical protein